MQVNNEGAIRFYEKFGFKIVEEKKNYYKRIEPADAYVLQKSFKEDADNDRPTIVTVSTDDSDKITS